MFKLSKKAEYALMILLYLSKKEQASAKEIADFFGIPFDTVSKILQKFNHHHLTDSLRGVKGGHYLKQELKKISIYDFFLMIEDDLGMVDCLRHHPSCENGPLCQIKRPIESLSHQIHSFLKTISLANFLDMSPINLNQVLL